MNDYGKPKVAQVVFLESIQRQINKNEKVALIPCVVTRVGTKYFYIQIEQTVGEIAFFIDSWREKSSHSSILSLYPSEKEHTEKVERREWHHKFNLTFQYQTDFTLVQYRDAAKILGIQLDG